MTSASDTNGFDALDACHRQIQAHMQDLQGLMDYITEHGVDAHARQQAGAIEAFFSGTSREHHQDEVRQVFPELLASGNADLTAAVRTLQQDHGWIEENWIELAPQLRAIASGNGWLDEAEFRHYVEVFLELLQGHIALEETLIYPESKARWAASVAARVTRQAAAATAIAR